MQDNIGEININVFVDDLIYTFVKIEHNIARHNSTSYFILSQCNNRVSE